MLLLLFVFVFFISDVVRIVVFISLKKQPMEVYVDDETKLTLHGLQQYYVKLKDQEKNRKLFDLLDVLEFNQVLILSPTFLKNLGELSFKGHFKPYVLGK